MMNRLKIRTKMMLLYLGFSVILLSIVMPLMYGTISASLNQSLRSDIELTTSHLISFSQIKDGQFTTTISPEEIRGLSICVLNREGEVLYATQKGGWLQHVKQKEDRIFHGGTLFLVKKQKCNMAGYPLTIVVAASYLSMQESLRHLRFLLLALIPVYLAISGFSAFLITKRTLQPISDIKEAAKSIGSGDLSHRIPETPVKDEVGELIDAFNQMLDKVERSFQRERQFSSDASHELRTPVAVISACAEDALTEHQSKETRQNLNAICKESARMNHIIAQLLILTRGYEGRYQVEKEEVPLREMVDSVMETLTEQASYAEIDLENLVGKEVTLWADQSLMTELLVNILNNGIRYGRPGGTIRVKGEKRDRQVIMRIEDNGIGIGPNDLPHIFERFYRADKARDRSGSGLGLSIVQWIVELHQGTIEVESESGKGTAFTICLPLPNGERKLL